MAIPHFEFTVTQTALDGADPATPELTRFAGATPAELVQTLACHAPRNGTGLVQVDVAADITTADGTLLHASGVRTFTCRDATDAVVAVPMRLPLQPIEPGFLDSAAAVGGIQCATKLTIKSDEWAGTCGTSLCEPRKSSQGLVDEGVIVFAAACDDPESRAWVFACGSAEWVMDDGMTVGRLPMPQHDRTWALGVSRVDPFMASRTDTAVTDASGRMRVWAGSPTTTATVTVQDGATAESAPQPSIALEDHAAVVTAPPLAAGAPAAPVLILISNGPDGATVRYQREFGPCGTAASGTATYAGARVIEVRRLGEDGVRLTLADAGGSRAAASAECRASLAPGRYGQAPVVHCLAAAPLVGTGVTP